MSDNQIPWTRAAAAAAYQRQYAPPSMTPFHLIAFIVILLFLLVLVQLGLFTIAINKLGISPQAALLWLLVSLLGSVVNLPLFRLRTDQPVVPPAGFRPGWPFAPKDLRRGEMLIAINLGGALMPLLFCAYLLQHYDLPVQRVLLCIVIVGAISYYFSKPVAGMGIAMPVLVAPIAAAIAAVMFVPNMSAPTAYIAGTLGVLLGADLLRIKDVRRMGTPVASIGGAGTFDGIFITGIVAVLLA
jgi:uncharacterized membrane protein